MTSFWIGVLQQNHVKESKKLRTTSGQNVFHNTLMIESVFEHFANLELLNKTENIKNNNFFRLKSFPFKIGSGNYRNNKN